MVVDGGWGRGALAELYNCVSLSLCVCVCVVYRIEEVCAPIGVSIKNEKRVFFKGIGSIRQAV